MPERDFLTRSWTVLSTRRKPRKIRIPEVNTYSTQIQECNSLHSRLGLPVRADVDTRSSHFPDISTFPSLTSSPHYARSAPPIAFRGFAGSSGNHPTRFAWQNDASSPEMKIDNGHVSLQSQTSVVTSNTDAQRDDDQEQKQKRQMTPLQLTEHLRLRGYGEPRMLTTSSFNQKFNGKSRSLPKNPSKREKIKGRARLDYEMANMRALAFCEQQTSKVFRTASANMRNRDVQFVEDEMRENMYKEDVDTHDQTEGMVVMIDKDELFKRVNTWIEEVECAWQEVT